MRAPSIEPVLAILSACTLLACSDPAEHFAPVADAPTRMTPERAYAETPATAPGEPTPAIGEDAGSQGAGSEGAGGQSAGGEGASAQDPGRSLLDVYVDTMLMSYLGAVQAVVEDADGKVVVGAVGEVALPNSEQAQDYRLSMPLPAGESYSLRLSAMTIDEHPTACSASVGPFNVAPGSTAQVQVLSWTCDGTVGYLPAALGNDCFWVADWAFIGRTAAAVGEPIDVSASGHDARGNVAKFNWSTSLPERGLFANPGARATSFRCRAAGANLPLTVSISDGECEQRLTRTVSCF